MQRPSPSAKSTASSSLGSLGQRGMTLIEMLIVLAIIALMAVVLMPVLKKMTKGNLRDEAVSLSGVFRAAQEMAAMSSTHHRVVFDLDAQTYQIQNCPTAIPLMKSRDEMLAANMDEEKKDGEPEAETIVDDAEVQKNAAIKGEPFNDSGCVMPTTSTGDADNRGALRKLEKKRGVTIRRVHVAHLSEPATAGKVTVNLFGLGSGEKAIIELVTDEGDEFAVLLWGLSGRIEVREGEVDVDKFLRRNALGDREVERNR